MKRVERLAAAAHPPPRVAAAGSDSRRMRIVHRRYAREDRRWVLQYTRRDGGWKTYYAAYTRERVVQSAQYLSSECGWVLDEEDTCQS